MKGFLLAPSSEGRRETTSRNAKQMAKKEWGLIRETEHRRAERISALRRRGKRVTVIRLGPDLPFLRDHIVNGRHIVPGSAIIALIVDAGARG